MQPNFTILFVFELKMVSLKSDLESRFEGRPTLPCFELYLV